MPCGVGENAGKDLKHGCRRGRPPGTGNGAAPELKRGRRGRRPRRPGRSYRPSGCGSPAPAAAAAQSPAHPDGEFKSPDPMGLPPSQLHPRRACTPSSTPPAGTKRGPGFPREHARPGGGLEVCRQTDRQTDRLMLRPCSRSPSGRDGRRTRRGRRGRGARGPRGRGSSRGSPWRAQAEGLLRGVRGARRSGGGRRAGRGAGRRPRGRGGGGGARRQVSGGAR